MQINLKRAPRKGALFVCVFICFSGLSHAKLYASTCDAKRIDEYATVDHVYDGDTVRLKDGRIVRLVGMDAPELGRGKKRSEPFANKAKQRLVELTAGRRVGLVFDVERLDKYGRLLSHVFTQQGRNISALMLKYGFASLMTIPPNTRFVGCYLQQEKSARRGARGLWRLARYQVLSVSELSHTGYQVVKGRVTRISEGEHAIWLSLGRAFSLQIRRADLKYFEGVDLLALKGRTLILRGRVFRSKGGWFMPLRHKSAMEWAT